MGFLVFICFLHITVAEHVLFHSTFLFSSHPTELPKGTFLPNNWNFNPTAVSVMYKHKSKPGKIFQLMVSADTFCNSGVVSGIVFYLHVHLPTICLLADGRDGSRDNDGDAGSERRGVPHS